jgi:O-antigen/teichoic acid export membrane protein
MERLSKNFIWMAAAHLVSNALGIALFVYMARVLMPEAFGYLSYAFTILFFLGNFVDLGLTTYGVREIARDKLRMSEYASEIVSFRAAIALIIIFVAIAFTALTAGSWTEKILIAESAVFLLIYALSTDWAFQGAEKMHLVFAACAVTPLLQLGFIYLAVKGPGDVLLVPALYFVAALPVVAIFLWRLKFRIRLQRLDFERMAGYLSSAIVIWSISLFAQVYNGMDIFILGLFRNMGEVGLFTVARRVTGGIALFMVFLANALLPRLSCTYGSDIGQFRAATKRFLLLIVVMVFTVFAPVMLFSERILSLAIGSEYAAAAPPLNIMMAGIILVALNLPYSTGLIAAGWEKDVLKQAAACALLSVLLDFVFIPKYGMIGASIAFLAVEAMALLWILFVYRMRMKTTEEGRR